MDIGERIYQLRTKKNLTLEELASRTELTKGFLSQCERNLVAPSIQTLDDIAEALGVSLSQFFKEDKKEQVHFKKKDYFIDERERSMVTWIVPNAQSNEMEPILLELEPEGKSQVMEPHEGEEFGYVLQGTLQMVFPDEVLILKKGETFYTKGNREYYLENTSPQKAQLIWVCTPPIF